MAKLLDVLSVIQSLVTTGGVIIGGVWAYLKFVKRREDYPHIEFTVEIEFVGTQKDEWMVELLAFVENKGLVPHLIKTFEFDLRCMYEEDEITEGDKTINYQTLIPHFLKEGAWIPRDWSNTFIEPGLSAKYSYITTVPRRTSFVLLHGRFVYQDGKSSHTADRFIKVPKEDSKLEHNSASN